MARAGLELEILQRAGIEEDTLLEEYRDTLRSPRLPSGVGFRPFLWQVRQRAERLRMLCRRMFASRR